SADIYDDWSRKFHFVFAGESSDKRHVPRKRGRHGSRLLALARRSVEAAASAHALPEFFALLGRHALPALGHATAGVGAVPPPATHAAEEDPAQGQHPNRLPEGEKAPDEERRQQTIPQMHHQLAADE